jgi:hypothetical protein
MSKTIVVAVCASLLLVGCSERDLRQMRRDVERALDDAGVALEHLADEAEGPLRDAAEEALEAAADAREASRAFEEDPSAETRRALAAAKRRVDDAARELDGLVDSAPESVRSLVGRALDGLREIGRRIDRQLDED